MVNIKCPRCLNSFFLFYNTDKEIPCKVCKFVIPFAYLRDYKRMPPVFVQLVGLTAAGKTTFLDMLRLHLYDMDQIWRHTGFYAQPITQLDMDHKVTLLTERERGVMPGSTPKRDRDQNEVYIMSLVHMVRWNSRFLVLMDHSGEQFVDLNINVDEIPFLQHTPVTILLLSLDDLSREGKRVNDLVTSYITTLEKKGVRFAKERRQLIIVFSKADEILNLSPALSHYLSNDLMYMTLHNAQANSILDEVVLDQYIQRMAYISNETQEWVREKVPSGPAMLHMLEDRGISARFTVMSATGHPISGNSNIIEPKPRRVLDPFFWVLEYYRQNNL